MTLSQGSLNEDHNSSKVTVINGWGSPIKERSSRKDIRLEGRGLGRGWRWRGGKVEADTWGPLYV